MKINKAAKAGAPIQIIAITIIVILVMPNKVISDVLSWIFSVGLVIST